MTFTKPDALPDEAIRQGMRLLDEEVDTLKRLLESGKPLTSHGFPQNTFKAMVGSAGEGRPMSDA